MKSLKVVFFGTPEFAKTALESIFHSSHEVVGVVTVADKASGRGQKIGISPVKKFALENQLPLFQPEKLRDPDFLENIKSLQADVFVVVAFKMMPRILFEIPPMGTFNLHASLLPDYRGAAPINFAIINGEEKTGVTTFFINDKIDEGNLLLQEELAILPNENAGSLHDRLMLLGAQLVVTTLDQLSRNELIERPQIDSKPPKNAFKIYKEDTRIKWDLSSKQIHQFILGMSPYPAAFCTIKIGDEVKSLKIFAGEYKAEPCGLLPGELFISKTNFYMGTKDGIYSPKEVQLEGKKRMSIKDFLNGIRLFDDISLV